MNRVIVITGATGVLGQKTAHTFVESGHGFLGQGIESPREQTLCLCR